KGLPVRHGLRRADGEPLRIAHEGVAALEDRLVVQAVEEVRHRFQTAGLARDLAGEGGRKTLPEAARPFTELVKPRPLSAQERLPRNDEPPADLLEALLS